MQVKEQQLIQDGEKGCTLNDETLIISFHFITL
jgi:hypothetical protein